ncbi:MAG: effector-associated domain EAD1-containing protein [Caldilineaceae bacterium]
MTPEIFADLRTALASLYADETSIRRVVADAGLVSARIKFNAAVIDIWYFVLDEAAKGQQVEALLAIAERDYGDNVPLQHVCRRYRSALRQTADALIDVAAVPKIQPAPQPAGYPVRPYPPIINHDRAIEQFRQLVAPNPQTRFMRLLGDGKMGKTTLLTKIFPTLAAQQNIRSANIDMRNQAQNPIDFLHAICSQIDRRGFPIFDQAYEQWLTRPKVQITGLQTFLAKIQINSGREDGEREEVALHLTRKFVDDLDNAASRRVLLLFDTVDNASPTTQSWLMDKFLVYLQSLPHVSVVVSGRTLPDAAGPYAPYCCSYELRPVEDPAAYVRYCRELDVPLTEEQIHFAAKCSFFNPGHFADVIKVHFLPAGVSHG